MAVEHPKVGAEKITRQIIEGWAHVADEATLEMLENATMDGYDAEDGDVSAPYGWFATVTVDDRPFLIRLNEQGQRLTLEFALAEMRDEWYASLVMGHILWAVGIQDAEAGAAIQSYQNSALFEHTRDGGEFFDQTLSVEAQRTIRGQVGSFLIENVDDVKEYLLTFANTPDRSGRGKTYADVGHEFWRSRNGQPGGFDNFAGGEAVERLVESAKAYGEQRIIALDSGELGVT